MALDVPEESEAISFGVYLRGKGEVRVAAWRLETVGREVPTTESGSGGEPVRARTWLTWLKQPINLDYGLDLVPAEPGADAPRPAPPSRPSRPSRRP